MLAKLRKQKRKSADLEPVCAARAVISLTASAHASQQDAPRCAIPARACVHVTYLCTFFMPALLCIK